VKIVYQKLGNKNLILMVPISIDISEVAGEFILDKKEIDSLSNYIVNSIATEFCMRWEEQIDNNLHSTRSEYKRGIFQEEGDDNSVVIGLTARQSPMAMMIEEGANSFDEKEGFSNSSKRIIKKDGKGWYLTIPMRYATSEALGESGAFSGRLPKPIENLVKIMKEPLKLEQIPGKFQGFGQNETSGYKHKFSIYEGLQRVEIGSGANEKRGGYMNFRRVSDKSDPASWIHPGLEARNFMDKALEETDIDTVVDHAVDEFLSNR
jgi:hypothetical protein